MNRNRFLFFAFLWLLSSSGFAEKQNSLFQTENSIHPFMITEYQITGLEKTQSQVIKNEITIPAGEPFSNFQEEELIQRLKRKNLFESIKILYHFKENGVVIEIAVQEKTTLVMIPFFSSSSGSTSFGLFLMEGNLWGLNKKLFLGGAYSSQGWMAHLGYLDPELFQTDFFLNLNLSYKKKLFENGDMHKKIYARFDAENMMAHLQFGYQFSDFFSAGLTQRFLAFEPHKIHYGPLESSQKAWLSGIQLQYKDLHFEDFSFSGTQVTADYAYAPAMENHSKWHEIKWKAQQIFNIFQNQLFSVQFSGEWAWKKSSAFQQRLGGVFGFKTLPSEIILSSRYYSAVANWEIPMIHHRWGTLTTLLFYEAGQFQDFKEKWQSFYGPGAGMRIYLRKVAFPAVGVDIAANQNTGEIYTTVSVGFSR